MFVEANEEEKLPPNENKASEVETATEEDGTDEELEDEELDALISQILGDEDEEGDDK